MLWIDLFFSIRLARQQVSLIFSLAELYQPVKFAARLKLDYKEIKPGDVWGISTACHP